MKNTGKILGLLFFVMVSNQIALGAQVSQPSLVGYELRQIPEQAPHNTGLVAKVIVNSISAQSGKYFADEGGMNADVARISKFYSVSFAQMPVESGVGDKKITSLRINLIYKLDDGTVNCRSCEVKLGGALEGHYFVRSVTCEAGLNLSNGSVLFKSTVLNGKKQLIIGDSRHKIRRVFNLQNLSSDEHAEIGALMPQAKF